MATVFVSTSLESRILGYYAIATGGVEQARAPGRVTKGIPKHDVPVIILARLAVAREAQGLGLGRALLKDCLHRVARVSEDVGIRALLIHATDEAARDFYCSCAEFEPSPTDELHLFLLMKDLRKAILH